MVDLKYTEKVLNFGDYQIQTYTFGEGNTDVLALASFPHSGLNYRWLFLNQDLHDLRFIAFDIPGWVGKSQGNINHHDPITDIVRIANFVMDYYTKSNVRLFGYSYGAPVAIRIAAERPNRIDKIAIVSSIINLKGVKHKYKFWTKVCMSFNLPVLVHWHVKRMFRKYRRNLSSSVVAGFLDDYSQMINKCDRKLLLHSIYDYIHSDWTDYYKKIKNIPVLVVNSVEENKLFRQQSDIIRTILNQNKSIYVNGDHGDFLLKPNDKTLKQLLDFLKN